MATEIERKFLVKRELFKPTSKGIVVKQGYLEKGEGKLLVRVRLHDKKAYLTLKGRNIGISRAEYEYEIPQADAKELLKYCEEPLIEKIRYVENIDGSKWEIDEFFGENEGLLLAEIELADENDEFSRPEWLGLEVSDDARYFNSNLSKNPYKAWK